MPRLLGFASVVRSGVARRHHVRLGGGCLLAATRLRRWVGDRDCAAAGAARAQHPHANARDIPSSIERRNHAVRWSCLLVSG